MRSARNPRARKRLLSIYNRGTVDDNSRLEHEHIDLFRRFDSARYRLIGDDKAAENDGPRVCTPDQDVESMSTILSEIRQQPTYENFLRPISADSMRRMATYGPVIVLVGSTTGSHAIIIKPDSTEHLDLNFDKAERIGGYLSLPVWQASELMIKMISDENLPYAGSNPREKQWKIRQGLFLLLLRLLWCFVVKPISDKLGLTNNIDDGDVQSERIISPGSGLAISAALLYIWQSMDGSGAMFVQRATSSFGSSLRTFGIVKSNSKTVWRKKDRGLIVTMSHPECHPQPSGSEARPTETSSSLSLTGTTNSDQGLTSLSIDPIDPESRWLLRSMRAGKVFIANAKEEASNIRQKAVNVNWTELERPSLHLVENQCADVLFLHVVAHGVTDPRDPFQSHLML